MSHQKTYTHTHTQMYESTNKKTIGRDSHQTVNSSCTEWEGGWGRRSLEEEEGRQP